MVGGEEEEEEKSRHMCGGICNKVDMFKKVIQKTKRKQQGQRENTLSGKK